jgi:hypothetical protein
MIGFEHMALLHSIPKVFTGVPFMDSIIQCIMLITIVLIFNIEKIRHYIDNYTETKYRSKICFSHDESMTAGIYYLGIHYYIGIHCLNIRHLNKKDQRYSCFMGRSKDYEICGTDVHIVDNIYFTTSIVWVDKISIKTITIYSKIHDVLYVKNTIQSWIDEYDTFLKCSLLTQSIITVQFTKEKIIAKSNPWQSSVTFANRFFKNKQQILNQLDHFINNKEWFVNKGIPHTLGILLHGHPGCGKTSFIKCLANKWPTKHIINIRLNDGMNLSDLEYIINSAHISDQLYVPLKNRIYVIEDIDCMMQIIKSRDMTTASTEIMKTLNTEMLKTLNNNNTTNNNNLSYLLNILDGLTESEERIMILTSNCPTTLDPALLRPGRIDINVCFGNASRDELQSILEYYWKITTTCTLRDELCDIFTGAEIINVCRSSNSLENTLRNLEKKRNKVQYC